MSDLRQLHLCGATGTVRTEQLDGRRHLVVPVVALMEGVIHAVNAETPEFVPIATLKRAAASWNDKPVTLGHPKKDGKQCSANDPVVLTQHGIGVIKNSRVEGQKLLQEAWIDEEKVKALHPGMHGRLVAGEREEVSVGAFVVTDPKVGDWRGKPFKAAWLETTGDHLAFLPGGRGACSIEMGCGAHRAAMHLVTAESIEALEESEEQFLAWALSALRAKECEGCGGTGQVKEDGKQRDCPTCGGEGKMRAAAGARNSASDMKIIQAVHDHAATLGAACEKKKDYKEMGARPLVRPEGGRWAVYSTDGTRRLGSHDTEAEAQEQRSAIAARLNTSTNNEGRCSCGGH